MGSDLYFPPPRSFWTCCALVFALWLCLFPSSAGADSNEIIIPSPAPEKQKLVITLQADVRWGDVVPWVLNPLDSAVLSALLYQQGRLRIPLKVSSVKIEKVAQEAKQEQAAAPQPAPDAFLLKGYSPVALKQTGDWVKGKNEFTSSFEGNTFRFANQAEKDLFDKVPEQFSPAAQGNDVVLLTDQQTRQPGNPEFGLWHHGKMFLFTTAETRETFRRNPDRFALATGEGILPAETLGQFMLDGYCPVCLKNRSRWTPGQDEYLSVYRAQLYRLIDQDAKDEFDAHPEQYAPAAMGLDVVLLNQRKIAAGHRASGVFYRERIYLFSTEETLAIFSRDPEAYAHAAQLIEAKYDAVAKPYNSPTKDEVAKDLDAFRYKINPPAHAGLCLVSLVEKQTWVRGSWKHLSTVDGLVYCFASEECKASFDSNPQKYLPVAEGNDVVYLAEQERRVEGKLAYAALYQQRVYLFHSELSLSMFAFEPTKYPLGTAANAAAPNATDSELKPDGRASKVQILKMPTDWASDQPSPSLCEHAKQIHQSSIQPKKVESDLNAKASNPTAPPKQQMEKASSGKPGYSLDQAFQQDGFQELK